MKINAILIGFTLMMALDMACDICNRFFRCPRVE